MNLKAASAKVKKQTVTLTKGCHSNKILYSDKIKKEHHKDDRHVAAVFVAYS